MKKLLFSIVFCVLLSLGLIVNCSMAKDPALIVYLPMDDGSGDIVKDLSPNKLDGTIIGKDFDWVDAKKGKGLEIAGVTEIQIPDNVLLDGMEAFTAELWVKMDTHQATRLIDKGENWDQLSYLIQPWSDQQIYFGIFSLASRAITPAGSFDLETWFHLAAVFDGQDLILYIDGVEKSRADSPVDEVPDTNEPLEIGRESACTIDEFAMYSRALTPAEIAKDMDGVDAASVSNIGRLATTWGQLKH